MAEMRRLAKETAIYGGSTIIGKFLNWMLVPMYSYVLESTGDFGIVTNLYAWVALAMVILTYGTESGFFRFAKEDTGDGKAENKYYCSTMMSIFITSSIFALLMVIFCRPIATALTYGDHPEFVAMLGIIIAIDTMNTIPYAYLRQKSESVKFAGFRLLNVLVTVVLNIFFLVICPLIAESKAAWTIEWFYVADYGVGYIFVANVISSVVQTLCLVPTMLKAKMDFDLRALFKLLKYSAPLLWLGIVGELNQTVDKILLPLLYTDHEVAMDQLGIYGAAFKISMVMMVFTNAFRYAYEPFLFQKYGSKDCKENYADATKYFFITGLFIVLGMTFYSEIIQYVLGPQYRIGLAVVPIVCISYLLQGIFYNLSVWYKVKDKTHWGAIISSVGFVTNIVLQIIFIPKYSYWACVWAAVICYAVMVVISYLLGQHFYPINYPLKKIGLYSLLAGVLIAASYLLPISSLALRLLYKTVLIAVYCLVIMKNDIPVSMLNPIISKIPIVKNLINK